MNNPLRFYFFFIFMISLSAIYAEIYSSDQNLSMGKEAREFIKNMPPDLQLRQERAVRMAIRGSRNALDSVRLARNTTFELPSSVKSIEIEGKYRLYLPSRNATSPLPVLIYLHGGGWCFGSVNSCAAFCSELVKESGIAVLAAEYPLAPENPYPAPLMFCIQTVNWAFEHSEEYGLDKNNISIGGDSAGGNLALSTALYLTGMDDTEKKSTQTTTTSPLKSLVLFYPVVKAWNDNSTSWREFDHGFGLDGDIMEAFNEAYIAGNDPLLPLISPFCTPDDALSMLPETLIINADHDILRDQGKEMADRLEKAGVKVTRIVFPGTTHLFITVKGQPTAFTQAVKLTSAFITNIL